MKYKPLIWHVLPESKNSQHPRLLLRALDDKGREILLMFNGAIELRYSLSFIPTDSELLELMQKMDSDKICINDSNKVLSLLYLSEVRTEAGLQTIQASDCLPQQDARYQRRYDKDLSIELNTVRSFQDPLTCYLRWSNSKHSDLISPGPNQRIEVGQFRRTIVTNLDLLFLRRTPSRSSIERLGTVPDFESIIIFEDSRPAISQCHIWYHGKLNIERLGIFTHNLNLFRCRDRSDMEARFIRHISSSEPHYVIFHGRDQLQHPRTNFNLKMAPHYEIDLHLYLLRYMPHLRDHHLPELGHRLLGTDKFGLGTQQQIQILQSESDRGASHLVDYAINECHLMAQLWHQLKLEDQIRERSDLLGCTDQQLWQLEPSQLLDILCYTSLEMGVEIQYHYNWPQLDSNSEGLYFQVLECNFSHSLRSYYREHNLLDDLLLMRSQALPLDLMTLLFYTLAPESYLEWAESLRLTLGAASIVKWSRRHVLIQKCPQLAQNLYNNGLRLTVQEFWPIIIIFGGGSWMGLDQEGNVSRTGLHPLCQPCFDLERLMVDKWLICLSSIQSSLTPTSSIPACQLEIEAIKVTRVEDLSFRCASTSSFSFWIRGYQQPQILEPSQIEALQSGTCQLELDILRYQLHLRQRLDMLMELYRRQNGTRTSAFETFKA